MTIPSYNTAPTLKAQIQSLILLFKPPTHNLLLHHPLLSPRPTMSWMPAFPPPPPPAAVYPHTDSTRPTHSKPGSFGPVFIVLAAITALSMAACLIGRLCATRAARRSASTSRQSHKAGRGPEVGQERRGEPANRMGTGERYKEKQRGVGSNGEGRDGGGGEIKEEGQTGLASNHSREGVV